MSTVKTVENDASVTDFINAVPDEVKKKDAFVLLELYSRLTGEQPKMWGPSIIGFGKYHYKSERSRQEGDWMLTGFSPRKTSLTLYCMDGTQHHEKLLKNLGKHKVSGGSCLYINKLADVDMAVVEQLVKQSFENAKQKFL
jgi:hypothetical protein